MNIDNITFELQKLISQDDITNYLLKTWIYKDKCCVLDFEIDGFKFAFDIKNENNSITIDKVLRKDNVKESIIAAPSLSTNEIFDTIKEHVKKIVSSTLSNYEYFLSVIIPVYNREFIIEDCIKSLNTQTLDPNMYEVIFIDDYSKDSSVEKIKKSIDPKLNHRILERPINSGSASAPRNDGICTSRGRYVLFLDSDDRIYEYTLRNLYELSLKNNPDMVYLKIDGDKGRSFGVRPFKNGNVDNASISDNHLVRSLMPSKMVKKEILKSHNILFPVDIKVGEDRVFIIQCLSKSSKISILADKPYYYLTNHEGDRLSFALQSLEKDLDIVSRTFKCIALSDKSKTEKTKFFSSWMNCILESYVSLRLKSKRHTIAQKKDYISFLYNDFMSYKEIHSSECIYPEFKEAYYKFTNMDFDWLLKNANRK